MMLMVGHAFAAALIGVIGGIGIALGVLHSRHSTPPTTFVVATGVLCVIAAALAAIPGALMGALQDPAEILRVP